MANETFTHYTLFLCDSIPSQKEIHTKDGIEPELG